MVSLRPNTLYIPLYVRSDPPVPDNLHWALYHHHDADIGGGTKYHITNEGGRGVWITSHGSESNILKTFLLVGLVRIADIPSTCADAMDRLIRSYDTQLNDLDVTCRTWLFRVLQLLQDKQTEPVGAATGRLLDANVDLEILESAVKEWGNRFAAEACLNVQPRPVGEPPCTDSASAC
ncbi:hypothetical protein BDV59DRAFT_198724 [Aspergillus ambiguus]|uniref:uncharacterized protein n=1 Tax=Aspergillus ambiguus TaxID=176160 RepID=UPI003CCCC3C6